MPEETMPVPPKTEVELLTECITKLEARANTTEKALLRSIEQIAQHTHDKLGRAVVPLAS